MTNRDAAPPINHERLRTKAEIAERCQVSERAVDRWIAHGEIKIIRLGRSVRISEAEFQRFIKRNEG